MRRLVLLIAGTGLISSSCRQSAPAMPLQTFLEATRFCALHRTTYTSRHGWMLDEPLIDFSREVDPEKADQCFDRALTAVDTEVMKRDPHASTAYIWEWKR